MGDKFSFCVGIMGDDAHVKTYIYNNNTIFHGTMEYAKSLREKANKLTRKENDIYILTRIG